MVNDARLLFVFGELCGQRLDGDSTTELGASRTPHLSHAAFSEGGDHFVVRKG